MTTAWRTLNSNASIRYELTEVSRKGMTMMIKHDMRRPRRQLAVIASAGFIALVVLSSSAHSQDQPSPAAKMKMDNMDDNEQEVAHPFFSHMGMPEAVGVYSLRLGALVTRSEDKTDADFAFHFETGLTKFIGVHLRSDGILDRQHTELMFQFAAIRSGDGMSGFAPIIEFEFPTHSGGDQHINTLVGFSTALANSSAAFNQVLHYDPRADMVEGSAAFVLKLGTSLFPVVEMSAEGMPGERPLINLLGGMKLRATESLLLGIGIQAPLTERKDFSWQLVFQTDIEWGKMN
jgi:hypothetical protein